MDCVISSATGETKLAIKDTKLYVPIATLSTHKELNQKKWFESGTTLVISDEEMNDIMKITKSLEDSSLLIRGVSKIKRWIS